MNLSGKNILVYGLGLSGFAASKLLAAQGARVTAVDVKPEAALKSDLGILRSLGVEVHTGQNSIKRLNGIELLIVSPGIPLEHPLISIAQKGGIQVVGELELASQFCQAPVIGVTGTNGKSTTCALIGAILDSAGIANKVAGNIGLPLSSVVPLSAGVAVVEVSSYQLETIETFKPHIAVWMNLSADHLSRHSTIEAYAAAKSRIFKLQTSDDVKVYNAEDPQVMKFAAEGQGRPLPFGFNIKSGVFLRNERIFYDWEGQSGEILPADEISIKGRHNLQNSLAASAAALAYGVDVPAIREALMKFPGLEHRQEFVTRKNGVAFINDSKSTNVDSGLKALETIEPPIILIAGGRGKGESFLPAEKLIRRNVKLLITLGETAEQLSRELSDAVETMYAKDLQEAVETAWGNSLPGDNILLSPMCASFDMFEDFEQRGRIFKSICREITDGVEEDK
ncbi:MAG: UDP-N-acetylmuramoyl-L-alanine--D-glutamate ligase [candidate division Zixibacteria bacterium]|nr:UDP-N-acetylmuramoyl-L-alanine--D-glutamate ligase [Candidatus Tariuqbacter arcticus]